MQLSEWQAQFFAERVETPASGDSGVYFREQVFGAVDVLSGTLPDLAATLGERNFRFFVREMLARHAPTDALGYSLILPFLDFLESREELRAQDSVLNAIADERIRFDPNQDSSRS